MIERNIVKEAAVIVGLSLITAFIINFISPRGIALVGQWDPSKGVVSARAKNSVVVAEREIHDITEAKAIFDGGTSLFVDARSHEEYLAGHVQGAVSFPVSSYEASIAAFIEKNSLSTPLIVYCSGRECDDSHILAALLLEEGYQSVRVMVDGYPLWLSKGFPVEK